MKAKRSKTLLIIVAVVLAGVSVGALTYYYVFSPVVVEGIVDHKSVTGTKDSTLYSILLNTPEGIIVKDKDYEEFFSENDKDTSINKSLEDKMKAEYSKINYLVSIRVNTKDPINNLKEGETLAYFVSRDHFNKLSIGDNATYEVERFQTATIKNIIGSH